MAGGLFGGDIAEGVSEPLTIGASFDAGEQAVPAGIPGCVASLVHEFGFPSAKAAFQRCIVPVISLAARGLDHQGRAEILAVIGGGVCAAAIEMVESGRARGVASGGRPAKLHWAARLRSSGRQIRAPLQTGRNQALPRNGGAFEKLLWVNLRATDPCITRVSELSLFSVRRVMV